MKATSLKPEAMGLEADITEKALWELEGNINEGEKERNIYYNAYYLAAIKKWNLTRHPIVVNLSVNLERLSYFITVIWKVKFVHQNNNTWNVSGAGDLTSRASFLMIIVLVHVHVVGS
jgi:hypothetical protein